MPSRKYDKSYADPTGTSAYYREPNAPYDFKSAAKTLNNLRKNGNKRGSVPHAMAIYEPWMEPGWGGDSPKGKAEEKVPTPPSPPLEQKKIPTRSNYKYFTDYSDQVPEDELRRQAEEAERQAAEEQKRKAAEEEKRRKAEEKKKQQAEEERRRKIEEEEQRKKAEEKKRRQEEEEARRKEQEAEKRRREKEAEEERRRQKEKEEEKRRREAEQQERQRIEEERERKRQIEEEKARRKPPKSDSDESDYEQFHKWVFNGRDDDLNREKAHKLLFETKRKKQRSRRK